MKILVFSDTHLTDVFDEKKFHLMRRIIQDADKVIVNGDFWDGFIVSFDKFISSPWNKLFPLLKARDTVYVYGNHDRPSLSDRRVSLFSNIQTEEYTFSIRDTVYQFEHGHDGAFLCDGSIPLPILRHLTRFSTYIEWFFTKLWGRSTRYFGHHLNRRQKRKIRNKSRLTAVFGHTHYAEHDEENNFINTGYIQHGLAQYLLITNNRVTVKEERYS
jgi:predicted phosphodiesterase